MMKNIDNAFRRNWDISRLEHGKHPFQFAIASSDDGNGRFWLSIHNILHFRNQKLIYSRAVFRYNNVEWFFNLLSTRSQFYTQIFVFIVPIIVFNHRKCSVENTLVRTIVGVECNNLHRRPTFSQKQKVVYGCTLESVDGLLL